MNHPSRVNVQDPFLNMLRKDRVPVFVYLVNGIKLQGEIESFDHMVVLLRSSERESSVMSRDSAPPRDNARPQYQMVFKHAISTVQPTRPVPSLYQTRPETGTARRPYGQQSHGSRRPASDSGYSTPDEDNYGHRERGSEQGHEAPRGGEDSHGYRGGKGGQTRREPGEENWRQDDGFYPDNEDFTGGNR